METGKNAFSTDLGKLCTASKFSLLLFPANLYQNGDLFQTTSYVTSGFVLLSLGGLLAVLAHKSSFFLSGLLKHSLLMLCHSHYANECSSSQSSENILEKKNRSTDTKAEEVLFMWCR